MAVLRMSKFSGSLENPGRGCLSYIGSLGDGRKGVTIALMVPLTARSRETAESPVTLSHEHSG